VTSGKRVWAIVVLTRRTIFSSGRQLYPQGWSNRYRYTSMHQRRNAMPRAGASARPPADFGTCQGR